MDTFGIIDALDFEATTMFKKYRKASFLGAIAACCFLFLACGSGDDSKGTAPTITTQPAGQIVTYGQSATFTVAATGTAPLHYQWQIGATKVGSDSASLSIPSAKTTDAGSYTVTVSNNAGNSTSSPATLVVNTAKIAGENTPGVVLQSPSRSRGGKNNDHNYRGFGTAAARRARHHFRQESNMVANRRACVPSGQCRQKPARCRQSGTTAAVRREIAPPIAL